MSLTIWLLDSGSVFEDVPESENLRW